MLEHLAKQQILAVLFFLKGIYIIFSSSFFTNLRLINIVSANKAMAVSQTLQCSSHGRLARLTNDNCRNKRCSISVRIKAARMIDK